MAQRLERVTRDLVARRGGLEVEKGEGLLLLFERSVDAASFALAYHDALAEPAEELAGDVGIELATRVALHLGELFLRRNPPGDVKRGAKPIEVEGSAKSVVARALELAKPRQTLLTRAVFDLARRGAMGTDLDDAELSWLAHGAYTLKDVEEPVEIFELGRVGFAPLATPPGSEHDRRQVRPAEEVTLGWRPAVARDVPGRPHWVLRERVGEGGFGEVWRAQHKSGEQRVFKFCFEAERLRALKREVTIFRLLKETLGHRRDVARLLEWSFDTPPFFLEAEYTEGGSLVEWAERQGGIAEVPLETRLELVAQVAVALAAAHSVGVLHKDVKPSNVLITSDRQGRPEALLTDFGVGLLTDRGQLAARGVTAAGFTETLSPPSSDPGAGTRRYMAPELLEGKAPSIQADVYSLGVLLYQMVTGDFTRVLAPGWREEVDDELLRADVEAAVHGLPDRRLGDAAELARRLRSLDRRRQELARQRRARRLQRLAIAAAVVGVFAFLFGAFAFSMWRAAERSRAEAETHALKASNEAWLATSGKLLADRAPAPANLAALEIRDDGSRVNKALVDALAVHVERAALTHDGIVALALWSPDGRRILTQTDATAHVWDASTGAELIRAGHAAGTLTYADWSPDGSRFLTSAGTTLGIWDASTGALLRNLTSGESEIFSAAWSGDGSRIAALTAEPAIRIWDAGAGGDFIATQPLRHELYNLSWSPDSSRVVAWAGFGIGPLGDWPEASIFAAATGALLATLEGHRRGIFGASWSPDGRRLLTASRDRTARIWNASTGAQEKALTGHSRTVYVAAWSPDGARILTASSDGTARIWDAATGSEQVVFRKHGERVSSGAWSPDGSRVLTSGWDHEIRIWDPATGAELAVLPFYSDSDYLDLHPRWSGDGSLISIPSDTTTRIWDAAASSGFELVNLEGHTSWVGDGWWAADSRCFFTSSSYDDTTRVWDLSTRRELIRLEGGTTDFSPSSDETRIATALGNRGFIWEAATGAGLATLQGHEEEIYQAAWSPDDSRIATSSYDRTARIWDPVTGAEISVLRGHRRKLLDVSWSPDGARLATVSEDRTARVWDPATAAELAVLSGHTDALLQARWSSDSKRLATASTDGTARIWDPSTGSALLVLEGHTSWVLDLEWSPDGRRLLTSSIDGSVRIWDASRLRLEAVDPEDLELAVTLESPTAESTESLSSVSQLGFTETASIVALVDARRWLHVIGTVIEILGDGLGPAVEQLRAASGEVGTIDQSDTAGETGELTACRVRSLPGRQLSISPPPGEDAHLLVWGDFEGRAESTEPLTLVARLLALRLSRPGDEPVASEETASELRFPPGIVRGTSAAMEAVYRQLSRLAASDLPVLLTGETGVGKEHLAKMVHDASPRRRGPWIAVNCAAVPRELLEAELFGIGKGVATGVAPRPGKFRLADGGTLLLDEIGEMSAELQAKLLRALQDREIQPLGEAPAAVDVRIVAATNADLAAEIEAGRFRRDLYYRLAGSVVAVPSLRDRREEIPRFVEHFLQRACRETGRRITGVTIKAMRTLTGHPWPGNVRELEHEIRRVVHLCDHGQPIDHALLSAPLAEPEPALPAAAVDAQAPAAEAEAPADLNLEALEKRTVAEALRRSAGNKARAARLLGISRTALGRKIQRHGLEPES